MFYGISGCTVLLYKNIIKTDIITIITIRRGILDKIRRSKIQMSSYVWSICNESY